MASSTTVGPVQSVSGNVVYNMEKLLQLQNNLQLTPYEIDKVACYMKKLATSRSRKVNKEVKRFEFTESIDKLLEKIINNKIPSIDDILFSDITNTIINDDSYVQNSEFKIQEMIENLNIFLNAGNAVILYTNFLKGLALHKFTNKYQIKVAEAKTGLKKAQICA